MDSADHAGFYSVAGKLLKLGVFDTWVHSLQAPYADSKIWFSFCSCYGKGKTCEEYKTCKDKSKIAKAFAKQYKEYLKCLTKEGKTCRKEQRRLLSTETQDHDHKENGSLARSSTEAELFGEGDEMGLLEQGERVESHAHVGWDCG